MTKDAILLIRGLFKEINIFAQNDLLFNSKSDNGKLVWDDANEILFAFRPNNSHYNQDVKRMSISTNQYSDLQCISTQVTREDLIDVLSAMKVTNTVNDTIVEEILESYDNLNSKLL